MLFDNFKFGELRKSGLTELKVKNASCLKGKKMGIRKCFLQGGIVYDSLGVYL